MTKKIGIDTGGTFTDFVVVEDGKLTVHKEPSTPDNPARAVLAGLRQLVNGAGACSIVHGSTVATNALLERTGAPTALVTTRGFEDVLEIGRQTRPHIYDIGVNKPPPLVPVARRFGIDERVGPQGEVLGQLREAELAGLARTLRESEVQAVAVCLLHAYANPSHERAVVDALQEELPVFLTSSHEVLSEFREYERLSTTVVNAYVGPVMSNYLSQLAEHLRPDDVRIMQSNGGLVSLHAAQRFAAQTILSGPAGGAVGGFEIGRAAGHENVITFDMGGTSTDVGLCPGKIIRTNESVVGGAPVRLPVIDIHTVGAGGGSLAYRDPGGSLRVGPQSAGAEPGPVCYDLGGTKPTVTDANLNLGRLSAEHFLNGQRKLAVDQSAEVIRSFAETLKLSAIEAAEGITRVANATMERAIRVISLERGYDPRHFTLVCFGGAGAMHAADLARSLSIPHVLVPRAAGILSALGMLLADFVRDYSQTLLRRTSDLAQNDLKRSFEILEERARLDYEAEGFAAVDVSIERTLDMRYVGQAYELTVPLTDDIKAAFHTEHEKRYGYADAARRTEVVNARVKVVARTEKPPLPAHDLEGTDASKAVIDKCRMVFGGGEHGARLIDRTLLRPGNQFGGPCLIVEYSTTTVVPPDFHCTVDRWDNLILQRAND